jgi:RNA polymerase-interacting CarD/CdnL/TRCF family regulator
MTTTYTVDALCGSAMRPTAHTQKTGMRPVAARCQVDVIFDTIKAINGEPLRQVVIRRETDGRVTGRFERTYDVSRHLFRTVRVGRR